MPVPAGSKGPIEPCESAQIPPHLMLAQQLWAGAIEADEAENRLRDLVLPLDTLSVETNQICNLSCQYCYLAQRPKVQPVDLEVLAGFLKQAVAADVKQFAFVGKEPFADGRAMSLLENLDQQPARSTRRIGLVTNGTLAPRYFDRLANLSKLDYVDISLDGPADANDRVRGRGSFYKTMAAIQRLADFPNLVVASTLHAETVDSLVPFLLDLWNRGVRTVSFSPVLDLTSDPTVAALCLSPRTLFGAVLTQLVRHARDLRDRQIIVDLPLPWTAYGIHNGLIRIPQVRVDKNGATYIQPHDGVPLYLKLQLLPQGTWRWARITADGYYLGSLRMASNPKYRDDAVGSILYSSFAELHSQSRNRAGWLTVEWNEAIRWASDHALSVFHFPVLA